MIKKAQKKRNFLEVWKSMCVCVCSVCACARALSRVQLFVTP